MTAEQLIKRYPMVDWLSPVTTRRFSDPSSERLCCRLCIGMKGLHAKDIEKVGFKTKEEFENHLQSEHSEVLKSYTQLKV